VVGRISFALERLDFPRHSSHVAQLLSLGGIERYASSHAIFYFFGRISLRLFIHLHRPRP
jgi:hypothetical protein